MAVSSQHVSPKENVMQLNWEGLVLSQVGSWQGFCKTEKACRLETRR